MSSWRLWIGIVLIIHGAGHLLGVLALTSLGGDNWNARSWLLADPLGDGVAKSIGTVAWVLGCIGFVIAGLALLEIGFPESWWKPFAVVCAALSLITLALFWNAFPALIPNKVGAIAVNAVALIGILIADWPTEEMLAG
jgi:hypothetical protein